MNANATVESKPGAPAVTAPEENLINGAVTDEERNNNEITQIDVTLSVEEKPNPADKDLVDSKVTANQRIGSLSGYYFGEDDIQSYWQSGNTSSDQCS